MSALSNKAIDLQACRATPLCARILKPKTTDFSSFSSVLGRLSSAAVLSTALVALPTLFAPSHVAVFAQEESLDNAGSRQRDPNAQLLLKADEVVYDNDNEVVTAVGNVQLDYDGYNVVAETVTYDQKTRRVKARGNVEILEPDGNRIYADEVDLTDDFGEGFVNALRVETPDNTRFAAESAERFAGQKTVFNHGVYTACEPCKEKPDRAPLWQVKASKVILDGVSKTVTYEHARFELFGLPIAYFPYFSHADSSVKRKSGFLIPRVGQKSDLGWFYRQSYFWATGDTHDLTFTGTYYQNQGFVGEVEWRQQFDNGRYDIRLAGIQQQSPSEFKRAPDKIEIDRGLISTSGRFKLNPRWEAGWNLMTQSDSTFGNTYNIRGYAASTFVNDVYLRGLAGKSYFDLAAYEYQNQGSAYYTEDRQPFIRPVLDYNLVSETPSIGGEASLDVNLTSLQRRDLNTQTIDFNKDRTPDITNVFGVNGQSTRLSANLQWQTTHITEGGFTITPFLGLRGDVTSVGLDFDSTTFNVEEGTTARFLPTAGVEASYPILMRTATSSHVFEPIVQLLLRPDLNDTGILPNEDAQSLVFDATTLFDRDKFSGFDRIESGTRANVGIRYSGIFDNGLSLSGTFGQSYHIAGDNPFEQSDLVNVGLASGLDKDVSDYVGGFGINTTFGVRFNGKARFDASDFEVKRAEAQAGYANSRFSVAANYVFIAPQPQIGVNEDREQVGFSGSLNLVKGWRVFGNGSYDIKNDVLFSRSAGLAYHDECFTFSLAFKETSSRYNTDDPNQSVAFKIGIRTIGDFNDSVDFEDIREFGDGGFLDSF